MTETNAQATRADSMRMALLLILNGLLWAFILIAADAVWGPGVARWLTVAFTIVNGALAGFLSVWILNRRKKRNAS